MRNELLRVKNITQISQIVGDVADLFFQIPLTEIRLNPQNLRENSSHS